MRSSRILLGVAALLLLVGAVSVRWALTPFDHHVPLVPVEGEGAAAVAYGCPAPFGSNEPPVPSAEALEAVREGRELDREPCTPHRGGRRAMAAVDLVLVVAGLGVVLQMAAARRRPERRRRRWSASEAEV